MKVVIAAAGTGGHINPALSIADYIKEPEKHTIIYTSILLFIYILPLVLLAVVANPYPSVVTELFTNALIEENKIDYEIKDGVLVKTTDAAVVSPECLDVVIDKERGLSIFIIFDDSGSEFTKNISSENKRSFAVVFNKESVDLMRIVKTTETTLKDKVYNKSNDSELEVALYKANPVASLTYAELGCTNLSFSLSSYENETDFRFTISKAVNKAFEFINPILPLSEFDCIASSISRTKVRRSIMSPVPKIRMTIRPYWRS